MKISLAITTFNRPLITLNAIKPALTDDRVSEIIIVDDCSSPENKITLSHCIRDLSNLKINLKFNDVNLGMSLNKYKAVSLCSNEYVFLFDSDNTYTDYLDVFYSYINKNKIDPTIIYMPDNSNINSELFKSKEFNNIKFDKINIKSYMKHSNFRSILNLCNYIVNKDLYLDVYAELEINHAADTIHFNYLWLKAGYSLFMIPNMEYKHDLKNSGYLANMNINDDYARKYERLIMKL